LQNKSSISDSIISEGSLPTIVTWFAIHFGTVRGTTSGTLPLKNSVRGGIHSWYTNRYVVDKKLNKIFDEKW
jgi:hypothetical protein